MNNFSRAVCDHDTNGIFRLISTQFEVVWMQYDTSPFSQALTLTVCGFLAVRLALPGEYLLSSAKKLLS